jgi:DNA-binding SARP family transcriptional activator
MVGETLAAKSSPDRRLRIYLVGGIAMRGPDGAIVDQRAFAGRQARRVFARLAISHGPVPQADLADDLWGAAWPAAWQVALRAIVSKVRMTLARAGVSSAITSRDGAYELRLPADTWLDVDVAAEAIHRAETLLRDRDLAGACGWALASRAIASRPLLPGEEAEWLDDLRLRLVDIRLRSLECLAEIWLVTRDPEAAARDANEALAIDPFRESAHRLLIRAYLAAGEHGAAMRAYAACREQFREELGVAPSAETAALVGATLDDRQPGAP